MTAPVPLSLPGAPVVREVTWEAVEAYLRAEGWAERRRDGDLSLWSAERAQLDSDRRYVWVERGERQIEAMERAVCRLASLADVAPGVMLARIVDGPAAGPWDWDARPVNPLAVPWRSRALTSPLAAALVAHGATDEQAANAFAAAHDEGVALARKTAEVRP